MMDILKSFNNPKLRNKLRHNTTIYIQENIQVMQKFKEIELGRGIGPVRFGMNREELKMLLGEPDEVENFSFEEDHNNTAESWHYDEYEISVAFEEIEGWKITSIAVSSDEYEIKGQKLIGLSRKEVEKKLKQMGIDDLQYENCSSPENPELFLLSNDDEGLNLWFENGQLSEIQWCPVWEDEEEM